MEFLKTINGRTYYSSDYFIDRGLISYDLKKNRTATNFLVLWSIIDFRTVFLFPLDKVSFLRVLLMISGKMATDMKFNYDFSSF